MKKIASMSSAFFLLAVGFSAFFYWPTDERKFFSACENSLKEVLSSPSTYSKVGFRHYMSKPLSSEEYKDTFSIPVGYALESALEKGKVSPMIYSGFIRYEHANVYGTPVSNVVECSYVSGDGLDNIREANVMIDGMTNHDRQMKALKRHLERRN
ncbi:hypothetical protein RAN53_00865 [Halomonas sp. SSL-5]|uniref:hypothetical protein n=1 Tax=Halomonas sp. SSL-5 TaxID=3065855 RepID=UPI00273A2E35|nr:hypothetical protein [Halomonas sp. SSL-5]MDY7114887.1 hypothetical protein [Halomonas sp. SSL-5]